MSNQTVIPATIPSGGTVSEAIAVNPQIIVGLTIPVLTAASTVYINVKAESEDAFVRLQVSDGTGDFSVVASAGSKAVWIPDLAPFPIIQVETDPLQAADRIFKFVYKNPSKEGA